MSNTSTSELQTQADLQNQINQLLQSRLVALKAQEKALTNQVQLAVDMCKALKCEDLETVGSRIESLRSELEKASDAAGDFGSEIKAAGEAGTSASAGVSEAAGEASDKFSVLKGAAAGALVGLVRGFGSAFQSLTNFGSGVSGLIGTLYNLGATIVGLPFRLLEGLLGLAQKTAVTSPSPIRIELENIRKEFGDLSEATGEVGASALDQFRKSAGNLAGTGLTLRKIYGSGPEGIAKAMAENLELMKALGPAVDNFGQTLKNGAPFLAAFRKGLGLSNEQQAALMKDANNVGKDPVKALEKFSNQAINMGKRFNISSKLIARDMADMNADVANFGSLGPKAFSQISVYARKLGVEVKQLTGLISAFDDFETAATNAAKLSQAFGMNVDAMKMMQEQDPAARLSMLQKALRDTGKSFEQMNRSEQKLLISQSGLDDSAAKVAFSQRGMSLSYEQVQKEGDKASKKQMTQEQLMTKLGKSIERVVEALQQTNFTSFFDAFAKGFETGIMKSQEFKDVMRAINASLRLVFRAGIAVGKMFMQLFPGISELSTALTNLFSSKRYGELMSEVKEMFRDFFTALKSDPKAGVENFVARFKKIFFDFFKKEGELGTGVLEAGKTILKTFGEIFMALLPIATQGLIDLMNYITNFFKTPHPEMTVSVGKLFTDLGTAMINLIEVLWEKLWPPMKEMFIVIFEKIKPWLVSAAPWILGFALVKLVLTAIMTAAWGAVTTALSNAFLGIFTGAAPTAGTTGATKFAEVFSNIFSKKLPELGTRLVGLMERFLGRSLVQGVGKVVGGIFGWPLTIAIAIGSVGVSMKNSSEKLGKDLEKSFGKTAMQAGIAGAGVINALTLGLLPETLVDDMAKFFAKVTRTVEKFVEKIFPKSYVTGIRQSINAFFLTFTGLGELLSGAFNFDFDQAYKGARKLFDGLLEGIKNGLITLPEVLWDLLLKVGEYVVKGVIKLALWTVTDGIYYLGQALRMIGVALIGLAAGLIGLLVDAFKAIGKFFTDPTYRQQVIDKAWNFGRDIVNGIKEGLWNFAVMLEETLSSAWNEFNNYWSEKIGEDTGKVAEQMIDDFTGAMSSFKKKIITAFQNGWNAVSEFFSLERVKKVGLSILDGIISIMTFLPRKMFELAILAWEKFSGIFSLSKLISFAHETVNGIANTLISLLPGRYRESAQSAWDKLSGYFSVERLMALGNAIVSGIVIGLSNLKQKFVDTVSDAWSGVAEFFGWNSPATEGVGLGKGIVDGITNGISGMIPDMLKPFDDAFTKMVEGAQNGMNRILTAITDSFNSIVSTVANSGIVEKMSDLLSSIASSFITSFTNSFNTAIRMASAGLTTLKGLMQITSLGEQSVAALRVFARSITMIVSELSEVVSPDTNVTERIEKLGRAVNRVSREISNLGNNENSSLAVEVGKSLSGNGKLTIRHETTNINLHVNVKLSAEQIGKGVIKWSDGEVPAIGGAPGQRRFVTINRENGSVPQNLREPPVKG